MLCHNFVVVCRVLVHRVLLLVEQGERSRHDAYVVLMLHLSTNRFDTHRLVGKLVLLDPRCALERL